MLTLYERLQQLIRDCQAAPRGSEAREAAFKEIYRLTRRAIWNVFVKSGLDRATCEDFTQDVFRKLYESIDGLDPEGYSFGWMYRVAINHTKDYWRRIKRDNEHITIVPFAEDEDADCYAIDEPKQIPGLEEAVATLTPNQKLVIKLEYEEGYTKAEVAELLNWKKGNVKKTGERARNRLEKFLGLEPEGKRRKR